MADPNGTLLQVAYGGYLLVNPYTVSKESLVYSEPGFTTISPIEYAIDKADQFYFIVRKRSDIYGTTFSALNNSNITVTAKDVTINSQINATVSAFNSSLSYYDSNWEDGLADSQKVVVSIDCGIPISSPTERSRVIDCSIRDKTDNSIIFFRISIDDYSKTFSYLSVDTNEPSSRNIYSTAGSSVYKSLTGKGSSYILISPFVSFYETTEDESNFSYPLNTRFYNRQDSYNEEDFSYSISSYSNVVLENGVRVKNVPTYPKMGVCIIDRVVYNDIASLNNVYVDVEVRGLLSDMRDTFRINLTRA